MPLVCNSRLGNTLMVYVYVALVCLKTAFLWLPLERRRSWLDLNVDCVCNYHVYKNSSLCGVPYRSNLFASCRSKKSVLIPPTNFRFPRHFLALRFYVLVLFPLAYCITSQFTPWFNYLTILSERGGKVKIVPVHAVKACTEGEQSYSSTHYEQPYIFSALWVCRETIHVLVYSTWFMFLLCFPDALSDPAWFNRPAVLVEEYK